VAGVQPEEVDRAIGEALGCFGTGLAVKLEGQAATDERREVGRERREEVGLVRGAPIVDVLKRDALAAVQDLDSEMHGRAYPLVGLARIADPVEDLDRWSRGQLPNCGPRDAVIVDGYACDCFPSPSSSRDVHHHWQRPTESWADHA